MYWLGYMKQGSVLPPWMTPLCPASLDDAAFVRAGQSWCEAVCPPSLHDAACQGRAGARQCPPSLHDAAFVRAELVRGSVQPPWMTPRLSGQCWCEAVCPPSLDDAAFVRAELVRGRVQFLRGRRRERVCVF
ncbi:hypothetical protein E2C01_025487 [Portunus trituberculatus]|uniref:Uncharacterized protein n=1 Tax=Portunus trituberculatus TaxID=210409 RepID=A0A5B7EDF8_PORTR|nr:hypothetical protein [Portunus trituberculatus]